MFRATSSQHALAARPRSTHRHQQGPPCTHTAPAASRVPPPPLEPRSTAAACMQENNLSAKGRGVFKASGKDKPTVAMRVYTLSGGVNLEDVCAEVLHQRCAVRAVRAVKCGPTQHATAACGRSCCAARHTAWRRRQAVGPRCRGDDLRGPGCGGAPWAAAALCGRRVSRVRGSRRRCRL